MYYVVVGKSFYVEFSKAYAEAKKSLSKNKKFFSIIVFAFYPTAKQIYKYNSLYITGQLLCPLKAIKNLLFIR